MTDNTNNATGILGNTQAAGAAQATAARQDAKASWKTSIWTKLGIAITLITIAYLLMTGMQWNFFWKLIAGGLVIWTAGKLESWVSAELLWSWAGILRTVGVGIIAVTFATSGFFAKVSNGVNKMEDKAAVSAGLRPATPVPAPAVQMVIWEVGTEYELGTTPQSGVIPATGLVFQIPSFHCIGVTMESGLPATIIGLGNEGNGDRTQVIPDPADNSRKAKVRAKSC